MVKETRYNPERKIWKGFSYKKGGKRIASLRQRAIMKAALAELSKSCWTMSGFNGGRL